MIFRLGGLEKRRLLLFIFLVISAVLSGTSNEVFGVTYYVWEKVDITLKAAKSYDNAYKEVEVWVDLEGPESVFKKRCYGFWDGGDIFRVRVMATAAGKWRWQSGSNQPDSELNGKKGSFTARPWSEAQKQGNPCRRGMIKASTNGHAFEYADGTPYFLLGDTWWSTATFRYRWYDDKKQRSIGPDAGFKDYVGFRRKQGFNCIAMIAAFPNWANDDKPATLKTADGTVLRSAWKQLGTESAKDMHDEDGNRAFLFPGKVPGYENYFPDVDRINPEYFRNMDRKIDYLNSQGFVPFIEVSRRDIGQAWKKHYQWPQSYTRYIQYVWSRYQANICLFSPIHLDWTGATISADDWNEAANKVIEKYGPPPFGTPAGTNSNPSTLRNFGHVDKAKWLTFHQIGNKRTHDLYPYLTEIFNTSPPVPGINGEPYYAGMLDAPGGTETSELYCRSGMYGSVLSGGLGGHIYGAGGWDGGMWGGNVEDAADNHIWDVIKWQSAAQMQHLRTFILSEGRRYQELIPSANLLSPGRSGKADSCIGWAYCLRAPEKDFFLLYFEKDCPVATLSGGLSNMRYEARWFNPRTGEWIDAGVLIADASGQIALPNFPGNLARSDTDLGLKLKSVDTR
ncbi:MAG: DUF4038 domain-containing protein [Phycisphaerae bacterium]|nr:DUF4038 domain-containing protein [Phycisphaerae bacterium]